MDTNKAKLIVGAIIAAMAAVGGVLIMGADRMHNGASPGSLTGTAQPGQMENGKKPVEHKMPLPYRNEAERQGWVQRNRHFAGLWIARHERDVTKEIAVFLDDPDPQLRERAAQALGRLKSPTAEVALQARLKQLQRTKPQGAKNREEAALQLALGRIRARNLRGEAKVESLAQSVGLSFDDVARLSQKVNAPKSWDVGGPEDDIVKETVALIYAMRKEGEDVEPLVGRLALSRAQQVKLQGASLPEDQEIKLILDYLTSIKVEGNDDANLAQAHLVDLGPRANDFLVQKLEEINRHPEQYRGKAGYVLLFRAAAMTGDSRVAPLLHQIQKNADPEIRSFAAQTLDLMEQGISPSVPG